MGQETVARIDALGHVNKTFCGVRLDPNASAKLGDALFDAGQSVGEITSVTYSPKLKAPLALAYVKRSSAEAGRILTCQDLPPEMPLPRLANFHWSSSRMVKQARGTS